MVRAMPVPVDVVNVFRAPDALARLQHAAHHVRPHGAPVTGMAGVDPLMAGAVPRMAGGGTPHGRLSR